MRSLKNRASGPMISSARITTCAGWASNHGRWALRRRSVVWSTRQLADELRAPGMLIALDAIWRDVDVPPTGGMPPRRLVIVDEAWVLLKDGEGAKFLYRLSKSARKRRAGVSVVTQDVGDLPGPTSGGRPRRISDDDEAVHRRNGHDSPAPGKTPRTRDFETTLDRIEEVTSRFSTPLSRVRPVRAAVDPPAPRPGLGAAVTSGTDCRPPAFSYRDDLHNGRGRRISSYRLICPQCRSTSV
jgi:hypothetical protein